MKFNRQALRVSLVYCLGAGLWIIVTNWLVHRYTSNADLLERLRDALMENDAYAQWTLGPLLRHLRSRLNDEDFELIRALAVEINGPGHDVVF